MPLPVGTRIGPYEVGAAIGEGGMGQVYRATDTNLKRDVAIKVLPEAVASDTERLARFRREAQVLASLNHPHIGGIYGLEESNGTIALVLELVDGPTLADRIARGPIPLDEALPIASQIAEALEAAHDQGIVHRDLKPANIKVRDDGTVKVLDFGLAKALESTSVMSTAASLSPTITTPAMTQAGMILGTAAYMSPEQARGKSVDKRADIWAFGCVLYEMLTGKYAFEGEDVSDTLASVLRSDPAWTALPADLPQPLLTLVRRCLSKDPQLRVSQISVARFIFSELDHLTLSPPAVTLAVGPSWRRWLPAATALTLSATIVMLGVRALRITPPPAVVSQFSLSLPKGQSFTGATRQFVTISPDGTRIAYVANQRIYLRSISELEPHAIPGIEGKQNLINPMFAPDGASLAFFELPSNDLKRIPISGGTTSTIASGVGLPCGASWGPDGILIAEAFPPNGIVRVSPGGGVPTRVADVASGERACGPQLLPGGDKVLFTLAKVAEQDWDQAQILVQSLANGSRQVLIEHGSDARYLPSGHLLYAVAGTMFAVPFDIQRLVITGDAVPVLRGVSRSRPGQTTSATQLAVSETGTLVYVAGPATNAITTFDLVVGDGRSEPVRLQVPPAVYAHPRISPDGRTLAVGRNDGQKGDIWLYDLSEKTEFRRFTFAADNRFPVWSSDGRRITFQSNREGDRAIWWQALDGSGAERLTKPVDGEEHVPQMWSRDGRHLLVGVSRGSTFAPSARSVPSSQLRVFQFGSKTLEPFGTVPQGTLIRDASFSPDGRWVAYSVAAYGPPDSPNGGVFVEPFPMTGEKHQAPKTMRDYHPVWASDGKGLFYVPESNVPMVSVPVITHPAFAFGTPVDLPLAPRPGLQSWQPRGYDLRPDGRFVSVALAPGAAELRIVLNWTEELKQRVPTR
jgi:eukaryotic-like serine/threonine-protein kinase